MTTANKNTPVGSFFEGMPGWARSIVFGLCIIPIAVAISGMLLNVNLGSHLDDYMELLLEQQRANTEHSTVQIIAAIESQVHDVEKRVTEIEDWACIHARIQSLQGLDVPEFCK